MGATDPEITNVDSIPSKGRECFVVKGEAWGARRGARGVGREARGVREVKRAYAHRIEASN